MSVGESNWARRASGPPVWRAGSIVFVALAVGTLSAGQRRETPSTAATQDISGHYRLSNPKNYLSLVQDGKRLHGSLTLAQPGEESIEQMEFGLVEGSREDGEVKFRTAVVHGRFYSFAGKLERGAGKSRRQDDFLRIVGVLVEHREGHPERAREVVFRWVPSDLAR